MQTIHATARSGASPQTVWALLADVETWPQWAAFDAADLEQPGSPDPHGLDAIRRFRRGGHTTPRARNGVRTGPPLGYVLLSGIPIREYRADVTLEPENGRDAHYLAHFQSRSKRTNPRAVMRLLRGASERWAGGRVRAGRALGRR
jgi:hypothetical protein